MSLEEWKTTNPRINSNAVIQYLYTTLVNFVLSDFNIENQSWLSPLSVIKGPNCKHNFGRYAHATALVGNRVYIFGGSRIQSPNLFLNDLSYIDLPESTCNSGTYLFHNITLGDSRHLEMKVLMLSDKAKKLQPGPRSAIAFEIIKKGDSKSQQMWIMGGSNFTDFFNDMYYFDFTDQMWHQALYDEQRSIAIPTPRASHTMVHFAKPNVFYVFGGGNFHQFFNDLFVFDIATRTWFLPSVSGQEPPAPRASHTATKIDESHFCLIGGGEPTSVFNDVYLFNIESNTWIRVNAAGQLPQRRCGHTTSIYDQKILLFGGGDVEGKIFGDVCSLHLSQTGFNAY